MMHSRHRHRFLLMSLLLVLLIAVASPGSLLAQNPNNCKTSGLLSYSVVITYNAATNRTAYDFTFYNNTPIGSLYVSIGRIFIWGLPDAYSTQQPAGYVFYELGQSHSWETTVDPWWYPPSIPPGGSLGGFQYVISGPPQTITDVTDQFQGVNPDDPTWETPGPDGGFDCATAIVVATPCVEITKTPDVTSAQAGDTITYDYEVCNCGNVPVTVTSITDDNTDIGSLLDEFYAANGDSYVLAVSDCVQFSADYTVQSDDPNPLENCVEVVATYDSTTVDDEDCAEVEIVGQNLCISIDKTADPTEVVEGDTVTYTFKVCNCSEVTLTVTDLDDTILGSVLANFYAANGDSYDLDPDQCVEFDIEYETDSGDVGTLENCVTVKAEDDQQNGVMDSDCATVEVEAANPKLDVTKTVTPTTAAVGQQVTYHYRLCNTGNLPLEITQFSDSIPEIGDLLDEFYTANGDSYILEVDDCVEFSVQYTAQEGDVPLLENCVTVKGEPQDDIGGVEVEDCAQLTVTEEPINTRQCFVPVTFTVDGWAQFCDPNNNLIPGGLVYNRFPIAFSCYKFIGEEFPNRLVLGNDVRLTYTGKTSCLENLCSLLDSPCGDCGPIQASVDCPARATAEVGGCLLQETVALLMNIAYNDMRLMPKTPGVDLECYTLNNGPLEGMTVGQVLFIANQVLAGDAPVKYGLVDCDQLVDILRVINRNYEFVDFFTSNDRGYLTPDKPFGQPGRPHCPELKDYSADCVVGPCVKVTKAVKPAVARPGESVTYKFKVCNCGGQDLTDVTVNDSLLGDLTPSFVAANGGSADLAAEACVQFSVDTVVPLTDAESICNTVTVTGLGTDLPTQDTDTAVLGILRDNPSRKCFLPTTFTAAGWASFCDPNNGIIQGGMIYNRFPQAFKCFLFADRPGGMYRPLPNELRVGNSRIYIRYIGKTSCLERLCMLLDGDCTGCGKLRYPVDCPWRLTSSEGGGCLAVETVALLMNVAYNDTRLMPRTKGVNLECYRIASGPLKGATVAEVFNIANAMLQGRPPCMYGLVSCEQLVSILRQINANYEFVDFDTYNDRGFLIPDHPYDPLAPPHCPMVPMECGNSNSGG